MIFAIIALLLLQGIQSMPCDLEKSAIVVNYIEKAILPIVEKRNHVLAEECVFHPNMLAAFQSEDSEFCYSGLCGIFNVCVAEPENDIYGENCNQAIMEVSREACRELMFDCFATNHNIYKLMFNTFCIQVDCHRVRKTGEEIFHEVFEPILKPTVGSDIFPNFLKSRTDRVIVFSSVVIAIIIVLMMIDSKNNGSIKMDLGRFWPQLALIICGLGATLFLWLTRTED